VKPVSERQTVDQTPWCTGAVRRLTSTSTLPGHTPTRPARTMGRNAVGIISPDGKAVRPMCKHIFVDCCYLCVGARDAQRLKERLQASSSDACTNARRHDKTDDVKKSPSSARAHGQDFRPRWLPMARTAPLQPTSDQQHSVSQAPRRGSDTGSLTDDSDDDSKDEDSSRLGR